jgi:hypothetical protein
VHTKARNLSLGCNKSKGETENKTRVAEIELIMLKLISLFVVFKKTILIVNRFSLP